MPRIHPAAIGRIAVAFWVPTPELRKWFKKPTSLFNSGSSKLLKAAIVVPGIPSRIMRFNSASGFFGPADQIGTSSA